MEVQISAEKVKYRLSPFNFELNMPTTGPKKT